MFQDKNAQKYPSRSQGRNASKFRNKSAPTCPSRSAKMFPVRSAAMSPSNPAAKSPKSPAQHFTSALYAHNPPMADSSNAPKSNLSTIREPIWNRLHFYPPHSFKPYQVLFIVLFIPCLWNDKQTPKIHFFKD